MEQITPSSSCTVTEEQHKTTVEPHNGESLVSLVLAFVGFCLCMLVDVFKAYAAPTYPAPYPFPAVVILVLACMSAWVSVPLAHIAGVRQFKNYHLWQPFHGGGPFVVLQAFAWALYSVMLTLSVISITNMSTHMDRLVGLDGMIGAGVGGLGLVATSMVLASLEYFDDTPKQTSTQVINNSSVQFLKSVCLHGEVTLSMVLAVVSLFLFTLADCAKSMFGPDHFLVEHTPAIVIIATTAFCLATPLTHCLCGKRLYAEYRAWQPFEGPLKFVLLQAFGWMLFSVGLLIALMMLFNGVDCISVDGALTGVGVMGFGSELLVLLSLQHFATPATEREPVNPTKWSYCKNGEILVSIFLSVSSFCLLISVDLMKKMHGKMPMGTSILVMASMIGFLASAPIIHAVGGKRMYKTYKIWQPFLGGMKFMLLQAFGWCLYSVALVVVMICAIKGLDRITVDGIFTVIGMMGFSSSMLILGSMPYFDESSVLRLNKGKGKKYGTYGPAWCNGESLVSLFLAVGCLVLFALADLVKANEPQLGLVLVFVSTLSFLATGFLTHCVGGRRMHGTVYHLWQPMRGGTKFVLLQAIGWSIYSIMFMIMLIFLTNGVERFTVDGLITAVGVCGFVSQLLLVISLPVFDKKAAIAYDNSPQNKKAYLDWNCGETFVSFSLAIGSHVMFLTVDLLRKFPLNPAIYVPLTPIAMFATMAFTIAPPLTHLVVGRKKYPNTYKAWQPFEGGLKFVLLHALGWLLYTLALMGSFVLLYYGIDRIPLDGVVAAVGGTGFTAQMLILISLQFFEEGSITRLPASNAVPNSTRTLNAATTSDAAPSSDAATPVQHTHHRVHPEDADNLVSLFLAVGSLSTFIVMDVIVKTYVDFPILPIIVFATIAFCLASPLAYFVGSKKHSSYSMWQPFFGGTKFVFLQAVAWTMYAVSISLALICVYFSMNHVNMVEGLMTSTGAGGLAAQILVTISVKYFDDTLSLGAADSKRNPKFNGKRAAGVVVSISELKDMLHRFTSFMSTWGVNGAITDFRDFLLVASFYQVHLLVLSSWFVGAALLGRYALVLLIPYAIWSMRDNSQHTGKRRWQVLRDQAWMWESFMRYFQAEIVADVDDNDPPTEDKPFLDPNKVYLFGFHPHAIYPFTVIWGPLSAQWRKLFPGLDLDFLGASVVFWFPILRDICVWFGCRDVSKKTFEIAFSQKRSVLMVPGGQAEMRLHSSADDEIMLVAHHKGFIRVALQHGVSLVPIFSFGEIKLFDNIKAPKIQQWFARRVGFGFPHFPYGRWLLPIPRPAKLAVVVGKPIEVPHIPNPNQQQVDYYHKLYFDGLSALFEKHKHKYGCAHTKLVLHTHSRHHHRHHQTPTELPTPPPLPAIST